MYRIEPFVGFILQMVRYCLMVPLSVIRHTALLSSLSHLIKKGNYEYQGGISERQCLIDIEGHVNDDCAEQLRRTLFSPLAADHEFIIDLSDVNDIDDSAIRLLVMLKLEGYVRGNYIKLVGDNSCLAQIMELCELQKFLDNST